MKYFVSLLFLLPFVVNAKGLSPYLPQQISPEIETYIEKLFAVTNSVPLTKPYKAADILAKAETIRTSYPTLYRKIHRYLQRYTKRGGRTHSSIELNFSDDELSMPNQRGASYDNDFRISSTGFYQFNPYTILSLGVEKRDSSEPVHYASYIGFGYEYAQVEVGYRDHWFSPFQDSAMLTSINAASSPSISVSNSTPISRWNIRYELFAAKLEELESSVENQPISFKNPKLAGIHLSFSPLPNWSLGFNRTVQYGDNLQDLGLGELIDDFVDPTNSEGLTNDATNHLASITSKINFYLGVPVSIYAEYGGDTGSDGSLLGFQDETVSLGIFLPYFRESLALRYEFNKWSSAWYVHPSFIAGYSDKGNIIGHWAAEQYSLGNNENSQVHSLMLSQENVFGGLFDVTLRAITSSESDVYQNGYDAQIRYSFANKLGFWGFELNTGDTVTNNKYARLSLFYRW